jgi:hypothetical protein
VITDACLEPVLRHLAGRDDEQIVALARAFATVAPTGAGPWPFVEVRAPRGLRIRDTNVQVGKQIGNVAYHQPVWAVCAVDSGYDAEKLGSRWLKVVWSDDRPGPRFTRPTAAEAATTGWLYAAYTEPVGHDGRIPTC